MACWLDRITQLYDVWAIRVVVLFSFALHVVLILLAGIRRRQAIGVRRVILWLASQSVDWAATYVLGNLSLGSTSQQQQQLVTFWASFLLVHLGRPDNISAFSLEDDKLSGRQVVEALSQFIGAFFVLFKLIPFCGDGTFFPAAGIMFAVGFAKYLERTYALWRGDFGSIRSAGEKLPYDGNFSTGPCGGGRLDDDEQALLVAHGLFPISKGAFADYSVVSKDPLKLPDDRESFLYGWEGMCKVVEMELSLMYDILYTKAAMVHTWGGYLLRFVSPPLTVVAFLLFWFYSKDGQSRVDVVITYILLTATFLVDLRWLLGALGSTWTYAFLNEVAWCWLRHKLLCTGRWHRLRRVVVSLDLFKEPASYRKWSGTIGQYNLLHECTHDTPSLFRTLAKKIGLEDSWNEYQYHYSRGLDISKGMFTAEDSIGRQLFQWIRELLKEAYPVEVPKPPAKEKEKEEKREKKEEKKEEKKPEPDVAARRRRLLDEALKFAPELGEDILVLHIATDVFLRCSDQNAAEPSTCVKKAIKALSDYMMFLVAVRPDMVPGLKLSSLHKTTRDALEEIGRSCLSSKTSEKELACILRNKEQRPSEKPSTRGKKNRSLLYDWSIILSDGARVANVLLGLLETEHRPTDEEDPEYLEARAATAWISPRVRTSSLYEHRPPDEEDPKYLKAPAATAWISPRVKISSLHEDRPTDEEDPEHLEARAATARILEHLEARAATARILNIKNLRGNKYKQDKLEAILLRGWVRMLIYVSVRCSRDSHAKQLSRGGELTTIVWILAEHASIFGIKDDEGH